MRYSTGRIEFRRDDAWRSQLNTDARAVVTTLTFPLLAHYGYLRRLAEDGQGSVGRRLG